MTLPDDIAAAAQELLESDLAYELSRVPPTAPPPLSIQELNTLLTEIEDSKQRVLCHPDDFERVSQAVSTSGLGLHYAVAASPLPDPGQMLLMPSQRDVMANPLPQIPH